MNNQHHGHIIENVIRRNGHSITDIARLTKVNRRSVYNWFNQTRLKPRTIRSIGDAIKYDFTDIFPELRDEIYIEKTYAAENLLERNQSKDSFEWKDKYIDLLERHAKLLSQISGS